MKKLLIITIFFISTNCLCQNANDPDYSSYEISKKYEKEKRYLLAYKHLIIFKISNIKLLDKKENKVARETIDQKISDMENYLQVRTTLYKSSNARGYSQKELDSINSFLTTYDEKKIIIR